MLVKATNQETIDGVPVYNVQYLTEDDGWTTAQIVPETGLPFPYKKDEANVVARRLRELIPGYEFRVYPALKK